MKDRTLALLPARGPKLARSLKSEDRRLHGFGRSFSRAADQRVVYVKGNAHIEKANP